MKRIYLILLVGITPLGAFTLKWENHNSRTNEHKTIEAVVFMTPQDWKTNTEGQKITTEVAKGLKQAVGGTPDEGLADAVSKSVKIAEAAALDTADPIIAAVKAGVQILAEPTGVAINAIIEAATVKRRMSFVQGTSELTWNWKNIEETQGYTDDGTMFIVFLERTGEKEGNYLGSAVVDIRGQLNFKIGSTGDLYVRAYEYDEDFPGDNLELIYESAGYDKIK